MDEKDIERNAGGIGESLSIEESSENINGTNRLEPIRSRTAELRRPGTGTSRSISRARSNNGYGCDDLEESSQTSGPAAGGQQRNGAEKDPFEVSWDGGDGDPLCPRSMPRAKKWLIVAITSFGSFCV